MVAINFAVMAADLITTRRPGRMVALRNGIYTNVPVNVLKAGARKVDVDELYDVDQYRPKIWHMDAKPMFLY
jgi:6-phosphofructokinase 1